MIAVFPVVRDSHGYALQNNEIIVADGTLQRELADHAGVRRPGARPDRLRAVVRAARRRRAL